MYNAMSLRAGLGTARRTSHIVRPTVRPSSDRGKELRFLRHPPREGKFFKFGNAADFEGGREGECTSCSIGSTSSMWTKGRHATGTVIGGGDGRSAIAGNPLGGPLGNFVPAVSAPTPSRRGGRMGAVNY